MGFTLTLEDSVAGNKHCCSPIQLFTSRLFPSPHLSTQKASGVTLWQQPKTKTTGSNLAVLIAYI